MLRYLDALEPVYTRVGYGSLGTGGALGYEGRVVSVDGSRFDHALSTHPPARLVYDLGGAFRRFHCRVALSDEVPDGCSYADFSVRADGRELALVPGVWAGAGSVELSVDIEGARYLELAVNTRRWERCHAVWVEPVLDLGGPVVEPAVFTDCLGRADIEVPVFKSRAERCLATVASPGFEDLLDDMLGSLHANGGCGDALLVVLTLGAGARVAEVAAKYGATLISADPCASVNAMSKAMLYSIARLVDAERFVCLDADTLVLGDLGPLFGALDACADGSILVCREGNHSGFTSLVDFMYAYGGVPSLPSSCETVCRTFLLCLRARTGVWSDAGEHEGRDRDRFPGASRRRAQGNRSRARRRGGPTGSRARRAGSSTPLHRGVQAADPAASRRVLKAR